MYVPIVVWWDDQVKSHHLTFWQLRPRVCQQDSSCQVNQEWRKRTEPREVCARNQAAPINKTQQNTVWKCLKCIRIFGIIPALIVQHPSFYSDRKQLVVRGVQYNNCRRGKMSTLKRIWVQQLYNMVQPKRDIRNWRHSTFNIYATYLAHIITHPTWSCLDCI